MTAPQILWLPFASRGEFRPLAGGDGDTLLASEDVVWRTIGKSRLGSQLRPLIERLPLSLPPTSPKYSRVLVLSNAKRMIPVQALQR